VPKGAPLSTQQLTQIETLFAAGISQKEIARRMDLHPNTVWSRVNDPSFRIKLEDVRAATKRINAVKVREHVEKVHAMIDDSLEKKDPFRVKAGTGALKDMDQIQAVACGDEAQAGVSAPAASPVDLKILIAQLTGSPHGTPSAPASLGA